MTHVQHTARISNVDSVMLVNRIREMIIFELSKKHLSIFVYQAQNLPSFFFLV